ncbi:MAG: FMN-binding glutamate synthase family protein [Mollicutes bacterium]|jgi:glutamate synthase domain-containing protein 2|nr:FMN-binding glutamate synthase family protein [Mollicutes bacterium]
MGIFERLINPIVDRYIKKMFTNEYGNNPIIALTMLKKLGVKDVIEAEIRAETGKVLSRPYGSDIKFSPWEKLLLNPRQLFMFPTPSVKEIQTKVVIGKRCKKPLVLDMPIMLTGMSYGGSLSSSISIALAKSSSLAGTCCNTGESTLMKEVRKYGNKVIGQFNRADLMKENDLKKLDAIEIQLGQGAWGGAVESITYSYDIDEKIREDWGLKEGEDRLFKARMKDIQNAEDLRKMVRKFKNNYDVPIGVKIASTDFIEKELDVITSTECDYIVIDGCEGGTANSAPTLEDHLGLPTLYALMRTVKYLEEHKIRDKFDLIIAGGLTNPGIFLKALALGANAVYIGSIALMAAVHNQVTKTLPDVPPTQLILNNGTFKDKLDIEEAAKSLANFLLSCNEEMKLALQAMSKKNIEELSKEDLVSLDKEISDYFEINYVFRKK